MRRFRFDRFLTVAAGVVLVGLAALQAGETGGQKRQPGGISVQVAVVPMDAARTQFRCSATIVDLGDGSVLMAPSIQLLAGREGMAQGSPEAGVEVRFKARVAEGGTEASYSVEHSREGSSLRSRAGRSSLNPVS